MAFYSVSSRNAFLDASGLREQFVSGDRLDLYSGSVPANADAVVTGGTLLLSITLPATPFATPASGAVALSGTWSATASGGSSTAPTYGVLRKSADTGTATPSTPRVLLSAGVGSGEINVNGSITSGQTVTVTGSLTMPAS